MAHLPWNTRHGARLGHWPRREAGRPRILIAEDDAPVRELIDRILRAAGYDTARAVDGSDAVEVAERFGPFDLLLTDVVMPRMLGTELARRLRQTDSTLKVLYVTAYSDRLFHEKGGLWEDEAFLEKPASVDALMEAVELLLNGLVSPLTAPAHVPTQH